MEPNVFKTIIRQCKKCGKTDHMRANSKKCPYFVKKINTTNMYYRKILPKNSNAKLTNQITLSNINNDQYIKDMEKKVIII